MSAMKTYQYQENAIAAVTRMALDYASKPHYEDDPVNGIKDENRNVLLASFVGSGKTYMMARIIANVMKAGRYAAFVLSPGKGGLADQNADKMRSYDLGYKVESVQDIVRTGISDGTLVCVNWEKLKSDGKNRVRRGGDEPTIDERIEEAVASGIRIIVFVDECHLGSTPKAQEVLRMLHPAVTVNVSATPTDYGHRTQGVDMYEVPIDDIIDSGLIKGRIVLNAGLRNASEAGIIKAAQAKRQEIEDRYRQRGIDVVPLMLIQLESLKKNEEVTTADDIKSMLKANGAEDADIAVWLSGIKENIDDIASSTVRFLIFKQAIDTGWDAPRACVLARLRDIKSPTFDVQTLGRTIRTPEQRVYRDELLDSAYFYSPFEDAKFVLSDRYANALGVASKGFTASLVMADTNIKLPRYVRSNDVKLPKPSVLRKAIMEAIGGGRFPLMSMQMRDAIVSGSVDVGQLVSDAIDGADKDDTNGRLTAQVTASETGRQTVAVDAETITRRANRVLMPFAKTVRSLVFRVLAGEMPEGIQLSGGSREYADKVIVQNAQGITDALKRMMESFETAETMFNEADWAPSTSVTYTQVADKVEGNYAYDVEPDLSLDATGSSSEEPFSQWLGDPANGFDVWLKNGTSSHDFAIPYETTSGKRRLFFPDFIGLRGNQLWVVDVKAPMFDSDREDVPAKLAAMRAYEGKYGAKLRTAYPGGFHMEVVKWSPKNGQPYTLHGGDWCDNPSDTQRWRPMLEGL